MKICNDANRTGGPKRFPDAIKKSKQNSRGDDLPRELN